MKRFESNRIARVLLTTKFGRLFLKAVMTAFFLLVLYIIALLLVDKVVLNFYVKSRKLVEVPYISGVAVDESLEALKKRNLKWKVVGKGKYIIRTDPPGGILVKEGRIITLYLSDNPR
ncbi:MAG: PASTA domain-containing protein [candidate division WOR-3 bacterium]